MKLLRCNKCGTRVIVDKGGNNITCCEEQMREVIPNSVDAAIEKHVPEYVVENDKIKVVVNHVMEEDHYIEWIALESENTLIKKDFKPGDKLEVEFDYIPGSVLYSYCNKHSLWKKDVE